MSVLAQGGAHALLGHKRVKSWVLKVGPPHGAGEKAAKVLTPPSPPRVKILRCRLIRKENRGSCFVLWSPFLPLHHYKPLTEEPPPSSLPVSLMAERIGCPELLDVIKEDMKVLRGVGMGKKTNWSPTGWFSEVAKHVYVYHHTQHATSSTTFLSQIQGCGVPLYEESLSIQKCRSHLHHNDLHSFFLSNTHLLAHFKNELSEGHSVQTRIEKLEAVLNGADNTGTPFVCPPFMRPNNWDENTWTERLAKGLELTFPDLKVAFTAKQSFSTDILRVLSADFIPKECFMFRGVPDILLHHRAVISNTDMGADSDTTSEDEVVENSHQRPPIKGITDISLPEKLGELIASLHFILVSKILRKEKTFTVPSKSKDFYLTKYVEQCSVHYQCK